jgi:hypothetical protein
MEQARWTARPAAKIATVVAAGAWAILALGLTVAAVIGHGDLGARLLVIAVLGPVGVVGARCAIRAPKGSVSIGPEGVDIVGLMRTRHVPLVHAERFLAEHTRQPSVVLVRTHGRRYTLWITNRGLSGFATQRTREHLEKLCDELNGALSAARRGPSREASEQT